jgi:hypothetical protein
MRSDPRLGREISPREDVADTGAVYMPPPMELPGEYVAPPEPSEH